jgi:hypothetical protein
LIKDKKVQSYELFAMKKEKLIQFILFLLLLYWKAYLLSLENRQFAIYLKLF